MWFPSLFRGSKPWPTQPTARRHRKCVAHALTLERLEDLCLPSFLAPVNYPVGMQPQAVVRGDFNNDTRLDLAVANYSDASVSVLLGNADGTFQPAWTSATGSYPAAVASGDFNADGRLDLVTANPGEEICVLLGNGNGTFQAPRRNFIGTNPRSVAVGDFNSDGKLDVGVLSNWNLEGGISYANVLLGTGSGTFSARITSYAGDGFHYAAAVADFNGDGKLDFAASSEYGNVDVSFGDGMGTFGYPETFGTTPYAIGISLVAADLNNDGTDDLATSHSVYLNNFVSVLLGNGLGSFASAQTYATDSQSGPLASADFSGDGNADLVIASASTGTVGVLLGSGGGAFKPPVTVVSGASPLDIAVGDFNGDRRIDAVAVNPNSDNVSVLLNDGAWPAMDAPVIFINDVTVAEGNTGTVTAEFKVTLSAAYGQPVTIDFATVDGSATVAAGDYQAASGTLRFAPGDPLTQNITVLVSGDRIGEYGESFSVNLSSPANAFLADATAVGTILDDEPRISIASYQAAEGNSGVTLFDFIVTLSAAYDVPVTVDYATADLTPWEEQNLYGPRATAGIDYTATAGTLTIPAGQTSGTISVAVIGDRVVDQEGWNEFFSVNLSVSLLGSRQAFGEIIEDEPYVNISGSEIYEGNSGTTAANFTVWLLAAYDVDVMVSYATADGSASAGSDYVAATGTLTIPAGQTSQDLTVMVNGDLLSEFDEYFIVNLTGASGLFLGESSSYAIIRDDDTPPSIYIGDAALVEGDSGTRAASFAVWLSKSWDQPVTVAYAAANGSATAGSDYQASSGTLTIPAGQTTATITVLVNGDRLGESHETFFVNLSNPTNALITDGQGMGSIIDDEPRVSIDDVTRVEGTNGQSTLFTFTVTLSAAYDQPVTMSFKTANGSAKTNQGDYVAKTGTLTFAPGETTKTITIEVKGDSKKETNETFYLDLFGNSSNALFTKNRGIGTILNDD